MDIKKPEFDEKKFLASLQDKRDLGFRYYRREHRRMRILRIPESESHDL